jgi:ABC-type multidrug transport system ATPase subunit
VNDQPPNRRDVAYICADDLQISSLTVRETLTYAVQLRCDFGLDHVAEETARVQHLLSLLDLESTADIEIGSSLSGITGAIPCMSLSVCLS